MNRLLDLQNQFQSCLLGNDSTFKQCINGTEKVSAETRLKIYENAYQVRLIEALANNYPALNAYLGCEQFNALGEAYLKNHPSTYRSIRWFGDKLTQFLDGTIPYSQMPYLSALANFEWLLTLVFDAPDAGTLTIEDIALVPIDQWPDMRLRSHPSLQRLNLNWNVVQIWQALMDQKQPPDPIEETSSLVLWRKDNTPQFSPVPADEAWAIEAMCQGVTFGELCAGLCEWVSEENAGLHAASLLKGWIQSGLISGLD